MRWLRDVDPQYLVLPGFVQNVFFFFSFSDSFFVDQLNLVNRNRFDSITKEKMKRFRQTVRVRQTLLVD